MKGRLELGCTAMIVGVTNAPWHQTKFVGCTGTLVRGPFIFKGVERWDIEGDSIRAAKGRETRRKGWLGNVPASVLVRIDDPDVKLDEQTDQPKEVTT